MKPVDRHVDEQMLTGTCCPVSILASSGKIKCTPKLIYPGLLTQAKKDSKNFVRKKKTEITTEYLFIDLCIDKPSIRFEGVPLKV